MSNECVVLWNIAFPLSVVEMTSVASAGLFNLITNLRLDKRTRASSVLNLYKGLREMMEIPVGHSLFLTDSHSKNTPLRTWILIFFAAFISTVLTYYSLCCFFFCFFLFRSFLGSNQGNWGRHHRALWPGPQIKHTELDQL